MSDPRKRAMAKEEAPMGPGSGDDLPARKRPKNLSQSSAPDLGGSPGTRPSFFNGCLEGPQHEMQLLRVQKEKALVRLEQRSLELEALRKEHEALVERERREEVALSAAGAAWDQLEGVLRSTTERLAPARAREIFDGLYAPDPPVEKQQALVDRLLAAAAAAGATGASIVPAAVAERHGRAIAELAGATVDALLRQRQAASTVAQALREAVAERRADEAVRRLQQESESLTRQLDSAQDTLDAATMRQRATTAQLASALDTIRRLQARLDAFQADSDRLVTEAEAGRMALAKLRAATAAATAVAPSPQMSLGSPALGPHTTLQAPQGAPSTSPAPAPTPPLDLTSPSPKLPPKKAAVAAVAASAEAAAQMQIQQAQAAQMQIQQAQSAFGVAEVEDRHRREVAELRAEIDSVSAQRFAAQQQNAQMARFVAEERERADASARQLSATVANLMAAQEQLQKLQLELEDALQRRADLERQLERMSDENRRLYEAAERAFSEAQAASGASAGAGGQQQQAEYQVLIESLKKDCERLRQALTAEREHRSNGAAADDMAAELGVIEESYQEMLDQNKRLTEQLSQRSDTNMQLVREKMRLEQRITMLQDERTKLLATIKDREEKTAALAEQMGRKDDAIRASNATVGSLTRANVEATQTAEYHRRAAADAQQLAAEKKTLADTLQQALVEAQKRASDADLSAQRAAEDRDSLKKRMERTSLEPQNVPKRIVQLEEEIENFRRKFRCTVCNDREKDSIITRCCHVFCDACIKDSIQRRHRKCPSCGLPFSHTDVHKIWL